MLILLRDSFDTKNVVKVKPYDNDLYNLNDEVVGKVNEWGCEDFFTEE